MGLVGKKLDKGQPNTRQEGARKALFTLTSINLLNYGDRFVPSAIKVLL